AMSPRPTVFTPQDGVALLARASLNSVSRSDGMFLQLRISLRTESAHHLRVAGPRIYIDLAPIPVADEPIALRRLSLPTASAAAAPGATAEPPSNDDVDGAYKALETTMLRRAKDLSLKPDVRALLRLPDELRKRDTELGQQRPALVERVQLELRRYTE